MGFSLLTDLLHDLDPPPPQLHSGCCFGFWIGGFLVLALVLVLALGCLDFGRRLLTGCPAGSLFFCWLFCVGKRMWIFCLGFWIFDGVFWLHWAVLYGVSCSCKGTHLSWCLVLSVCCVVMRGRERGWKMDVEEVIMPKGLSRGPVWVGWDGWMASWVGGN